MKILLAIDGSPCSCAAVREISRRPWPQGSEVRILTVEPPVDDGLLLAASPTVFDEVVKQKRTEAVQRLADAVNEFRIHAPSLTATPVLAEGWPKDAILDEAERWGADLIVVGSHGRRGVRRFLLGSVSLAVAANARCSVEIVRVPEPADDSFPSTD